MCDQPALAEMELPAGLVELTELRVVCVERKLGYFGQAPFVIIGYCPGGGEVIWKDGLSWGFGAGGWRTFLEEIAPLARLRGIHLGAIDSAGTHVLLVDRRGGVAYAAARQCAEEFLARVSGTSAPSRPCLCARQNCSLCPNRDCLAAESNRPAAGSSQLR